MAKIQYFSPKDKGVFERARRTKDIHPTLEDIKAMADDTVRDAAEYITDKEQRQKAIEDAKKTIIQIEEEEEK